MDVKEKLLRVVSQPEEKNGRPAHGAIKPRNHEHTEKGIRKRNGKKAPHRTNTIPNQKLLRRLRSRDGSPQLRRKFLLRLAVALHTYGNSAPRTEYLVEKAAERIGVTAHIAVLPSLLAISFMAENDLSQETHLLTASGDLDVDKLDQADELAIQVTPLSRKEADQGVEGQEDAEFDVVQVGEEGHEVLVGYWRLKTIATAAPQFPLWAKLISFGLLSGSASLLFFEGNLIDGFASALLGFLIGLLDCLAGKSPVVGQVSEFIGAVIVSFIARILALSVPLGLQLCYFPVVLGSLVWLLPGMALTVGISELVAGATVSGSSRIMAALFVALQLGFGMAVGEAAVFWSTKSPAHTCPAPQLSPWWQIVWFFGYTLASNVLLMARWDQWPGMTLVSGFGWLAATLTAGLGGDGSSVAAAFVIGVTGTLYSQWTNHLPLATKTSGILLLVPGGIGVQGVAAILTDDFVSGMAFVIDMMVVGLSITIGLLLAKIVAPNAMIGSNKKATNDKNSLATQLEDEKYSVGANSDSDSDSDSDDVEHMAI